MKSSSVVSCFCQITSLLHSLPFSRINKPELILNMHFLLYLIAPREIQHEVNLWGYPIAFKLHLDGVTRMWTRRSLYNQLCFSGFWSTSSIIESKIRWRINTVDDMDNCRFRPSCHNKITLFGWNTKNNLLLSVPQYGYMFRSLSTFSILCLRFCCKIDRVCM